MSRTVRKEKTNCKEIRTHLRGNEISDKDRECQDQDNYFKDGNRKYKQRKQELKGL